MEKESVNAHYEKIWNDYLSALTKKPHLLLSRFLKSMFFYQPVEAYLCVMTTAYGLAPKGYIELPLLMMKFYRHLSYVNCKELSKAVCRGNFLEEVVLLDSWQKTSTLNYFKRLCSELCALVETPYNSGYVEQAWQLLQQRMEIEKEVKEVNREEAPPFIGDASYST